MYANTIKLVTTSAVAISLMAKSSLASPADDLHADAVDHYQQRRWSEAAACFARFADSYPRDQRARSSVFFLAETQVEMGALDEAAASYQRYIEVGGPTAMNLARAHFRLGETAHLSDRRDQARRAFEEFHQRWPHDPLAGHALFLLGELASAEGQNRQAEHWYGESIRRFPQGRQVVAAWYGKARALRLSGESDRAMQIYRQLADHPQTTYAHGARYQLGLLEYKHRNYDRAAQWLTSFLDAQAEGPNVAPAGYWLGMCQLHRGDFQQAAERFAQIRAEGEDLQLLVAATFYQAEALRMGGSVQSAEQLYRELTKTHDDSPWATHGRVALVKLAASRQDHRQVVTLFDQLDADEIPSKDSQAVNHTVSISREWLRRVEWGSIDPATLASARGPSDDDHLKSIAFERPPTSALPATTDSASPRPAQSLASHSPPVQPLAASGSASRLATLSDPSSATVAATNPLRPIRDVRLDLSEAEAMIKAADFGPARERLIRVVCSPASLESTAAEAQWWIAESYWQEANFRQALREYLRLETLYHMPEWQARAVRRAGDCYQRLEDTSGQRQMHERLGQRYARGLREQVPLVSHPSRETRSES